MTEPNRSVQGEKARKRGIERRTTARWPSSAIPFLKSVKLVAGPDVSLINISRGGALIESAARLSPGSNLCIRLVTTESIYLLKGRVLRARAASMSGSMLRYQIAVVFDEEFPIVARHEIEQASRSAQEEELHGAEEVSGESQTPTSQPSECPTIVTVTAKYLQSDTELQSIFGVNDW